MNEGTGILNEEVKIQKSDSISALTGNLIKFQAEMPEVKLDATVKVKTKTGQTYFFKYATLANIRKTAFPVLTKNNLCVSQIFQGNKLLTMLLDKSGEYLISEMPIDFRGGNMQELGSRITYLKRYSLVAILGIVAEEDDDANIAEGNKVQTEASTQKTTHTEKDSLFQAMLKRIEKITNIFELTNWEKKHATEIAKLNQAERATILRALKNRKEKLEKTTDPTEPEEPENQSISGSRKTLIDSIQTLAENEGQIRDAIYKTTSKIDGTLEKCSLENLQAIEEAFLKRSK